MYDQGILLQTCFTALVVAEVEAEKAGRHINPAKGKKVPLNSYRERGTKRRRRVFKVHLVLSVGMSGDRAAGAAPVASSAASQSPSTHAFSASATPFIPSFMRGTAQLSAPSSSSTTVGPSAAMETPRVDVEQPSSNIWSACLNQMQSHEVGLLMEMMPPDIQEAYGERLSEEYLQHAGEGVDKGTHAINAAMNTMRVLSQEQLSQIEEFLVESGLWDDEGGMVVEGLAMAPFEEAEEEAIFAEGNGSLCSDEEEWLLEQMVQTADNTQREGESY